MKLFVLCSVVLVTASAFSIPNFEAHQEKANERASTARAHVLATVNRALASTLSLQAVNAECRNAFNASFVACGCPTFGEGFPTDQALALLCGSCLQCLNNETVITSISTACGSNPVIDTDEGKNSTFGEQLTTLNGICRAHASGCMGEIRSFMSMNHSQGHITEQALDAMCTPCMRGFFAAFGNENAEKSFALACMKDYDRIKDRQVYCVLAFQGMANMSVPSGSDDSSEAGSSGGPPSAAMLDQLCSNGCLKRYFLAFTALTPNASAAAAGQHVVNQIDSMCARDNTGQYCLSIMNQLGPAQQQVTADCVGSVGGSCSTTCKATLLGITTVYPCCYKAAITLMGPEVEAMARSLIQQCDAAGPGCPKAFAKVAFKLVLKNFKRAFVIANRARIAAGLKKDMAALLFKSEDDVTVTITEFPAAKAMGLFGASDGFTATGTVASQDPTENVGVRETLSSVIQSGEVPLTNLLQTTPPTDLVDPSLGAGLDVAASGSSITGSASLTSFSAVLTLCVVAVGMALSA